MRKMIFLLALLAPLTAHAFTYDGGVAPSGKTDFHVNTHIPPDQKLTAPEWNGTADGLTETAGAVVHGPYHGFSYQLAPPTAPSDGVRVFSLDGGAGSQPTLNYITPNGTITPIGGGGAALFFLDGGAGEQPTLTYETPDKVLHALGSVCPIDLDFSKISNVDLTTAGTYTLGSYSATVVRGGGGASAVYVDAGSLVAINSTVTLNTQMTSCSQPMPTNDWYLSIPISDASWNEWYPARLSVVGSCGTGTNSAQIGVFVMAWDSSNNLSNLLGTGVFAELPNTSILTGSCEAGVGNPELRAGIAVSGQLAGMAMSYGAQVSNFVTSYYATGYAGSLSQPFWHSNGKANQALNTTTNVAWTSSTAPASTGWKLYIVPSASSVTSPATCALQRVRFCYTPTWSQ